MAGICSFFQSKEQVAQRGTDDDLILVADNIYGVGRVRPMNEIGGLLQNETR